MEFSHDAILGATLDGTLVSWNAGAEQLYGVYRRRSDRAARVIPGHAQEPTAPSPVVIARLRQGQTIDPIDITRTHKDGTVFHAILSFSPIEDELGRIVGLSCIAHDATVRVAVEEALRRSEARLAEAQRIARIGNWEYDIPTGAITWSLEMFPLDRL